MRRIESGVLVVLIERQRFKWTPSCEAMGGNGESGNWTYGDYLRLHELLELQGDGRGISADEMHFIIVHQTFELWFKLVLRELKEARDLMHRERIEEAVIPRVVRHLERVSEIFRLLADQWKVMETLSPQDFLQKFGIHSKLELAVVERWVAPAMRRERRPPHAAVARGPRFCPWPQQMRPRG